MISIHWFRDKVRSSEYEMASHADEERQIERVTMADLEAAVLGGEIIEDYEDRQDIRGHACLISGQCLDGAPLHVVAAKTTKGRMRICTVYRPTEKRFKDAKVRKPR